MGTGASTLATNLRKYVANEFYRVKASEKRSYLVLNEILELNPPAGIPIDFKHLATIYALDKSSSGTVTLKELEIFIDFCDARRKQYRTHEYKNQLEGLFTLKLWNDVMARGRDHVEGWVLKLISQNGALHRFESAPTTFYVNRDSMEPIYKIFKAYISADKMNFQDLFDLMQHSAEEMGLLDVEDETLDDFVPLVVVSEFVASFLSGFMELMKDVGFTKQLCLPVPKRGHTDLLPPSSQQQQQQQQQQLLPQPQQPLQLPPQQIVLQSPSQPPQLPAQQASLQQQQLALPPSVQPSHA